jgi:hypothetical protein
MGAVFILKGAIRLGEGWVWLASTVRKFLEALLHDRSDAVVLLGVEIDCAVVHPALQFAQLGEQGIDQLLIRVLMRGDVHTMRDS